MISIADWLAKGNLFFLELIDCKKSDEKKVNSQMESTYQIFVKKEGFYDLSSFLC